MSVALFFISHEGIAGNLLGIAEAIMRQNSENLDYIEVPMDAPVLQIQEKAEQQLQQLDLTKGIIFFTDTYGSTPGNIAQHLARSHNSVIISGINLPMVLRLLNYRNMPLQELIDKSIDGGRKGIEQHQ